MKLSISMTRRETILGWSYLLLSMFVLPTLFVVANSFLAAPLSDTVINLIYFAVNFLAIAVIFRRFLVRSVKAALAAPWHCLRFALMGLVCYFVLMNLLSRGILLVDPDFSNVNDDSVAQLTKEHYPLMALSTVILVPVTEETLYRGLLFQGLHRKSPILAYLISVFVFAGIHIMGYIGMFDFLTLTLCFVQYLPAGICLAWAYEKSDTIVAPMLMHIIINLIGITAMR